jgi:hypothetical protein
MSFDTIIRNTLRTVIPTLLGTANLQYRTLTSGPGVEPRTYSAWTALAGHMVERQAVQTYDEDRAMWILNHMGAVQVADTIFLPEGSQVAVGGVAPIWAVSGRDAHQHALGLHGYSLTYEEPLLADAKRGGGV